MPISSQLESLAVPYELYPGVKLWMMPFSTTATRAVLAAVKVLNNGSDDFDGQDNDFILLEGYLVRVEIKGKLTAKARVWKLYFDARKEMPELADRRTLWRELSSAYHMLRDVQRAYTATYDATYDNTEDVPEEPKDDADPS